jgi:IS4 transposase
VFFGADILAIHLMLLAYDLNAGKMDKTYPLDLVRDVLPLRDQRDENYHNRDLKPMCWDEIREKLNFTGKYWESNANELQ